MSCWSTGNIILPNYLMITDFDIFWDHCDGFFYMFVLAIGYFFQTTTTKYIQKEMVLVSL